MKIRTYQADAINMTKQALADFDRVIAAIPTGGGKSTTYARFTQICIRNNKRVWFVVHKRELVQQFADRLKDQFGIPSGIIMSKVKGYPRRLVQVISIQTVRNRKGLIAPDVIIIDECHHATAKSYVSLIEKYPKAKIIGLTATPFRTGGKPLGNIFQKIVQPIKIRELIEQKYLVETKV